MASEGKNLIGVDIGSSSIKVCEIKEGRRGARTIIRFGFHPLPAETIVDGHIINSGAVVEGLEKLFVGQVIAMVEGREVAIDAVGLHALLLVDYLRCVKTICLQDHYGPLFGSRFPRWRTKM